MIENPGIDNFIDLKDVPHSYVGQSTKTVKVNPGETGLEFGVGGGGTGTVTSVTSATGDATVATTTTTPIITIVSAPKLTTARTIAITGDIAYTSPSFDGTGNVTGAGTLATVNANIGSYTNSNVTVNAKGLITAISNGTGGGTVYNLGALVYADGSVPAGNTVSNTTTKTTLTSSYTVPANSLSVGDVIRVRVSGLYSTSVVAPMITAEIKIGSVVVATTGSITAIANVTNGGYTGFLDCIVTNAGASGIVESQGFLEFATAATTALTVNLTNTAAVTGIDFTSTQAITINIQWSVASASNSLTMRQMEVDINKISATSGLGITRTIVNIATNTTGLAVANVDYVYIATAGLVFTLPTAVGNKNAYTLKASTTGVSFATTSSQTVDGSTTGTLITNQALTFISNNTNWIIS